MTGSSRDETGEESKLERSFPLLRLYLQDTGFHLTTKEKGGVIPAQGQPFLFIRGGSRGIFSLNDDEGWSERLALLWERTLGSLRISVLGINYPP
ncbi:hypothetical protein AVEN_205108-1 [Araneus ventricosus]|uniref:Uncharacterized protein n=1 Tax=Araneus ventricosus TaxID=182803 RepID=A0A4Y2PQE9_ARAVE|nr:hypothetical protein AVEN_205108-1 [Araneus ventricosus]